MVWVDTTFGRCPKYLHGQMDHLSLHYYVHPGGWENKGSATEFTTETWYQTLFRALYMEELVKKHAEIMDRYDPEKKVGMSVDEWGGWYDVEPGTNPGFLYQQNTVRDALIAGITLNIFNKHSDRVKLACLAQMVNVLQAVILTEGEKMVKTPTYHVMHMYRHHHDADLLESSLSGVKGIGTSEYPVPKLTESVSVKDGIITATLANLSDSDSEKVSIKLQGRGYKILEAKVVSGPSIQSHNTFDAPQQVVEQDLAFDGLKITVPAASVVMVRLSK